MLDRHSLTPDPASSHENHISHASREASGGMDRRGIASLPLAGLMGQLACGGDVAERALHEIDARYPGAVAGLAIPTWPEQ